MIAPALPVALRFSAAPAAALAIWILSSRPTLPLPPDVPLLDKAAHFAAYAVLAWATGLWFPGEAWRTRPLRAALIVTAVCAAYGAVDEFHQSFVPGRDMSAWDWLADVLGAGASTAFRIKRRQG
jgi:VanZ family protein